MSDEHLRIALPLVAVGAFVLALSFAFCCYLARCKHSQQKIGGYKKIVLNKKKDENPLAETKNDSCPVCLEDFQNKEVLAICPCGHVFHKKCLKKWLVVRSTCPMCMAQVVHHSVRDQQNRIQITAMQRLNRPSPLSREGRAERSNQNSDSPMRIAPSLSSSSAASSSFERPPTPIPVMSAPTRVVMSTPPSNAASSVNSVQVSEQLSGQNEISWIGNPPAYDVV